MVYILLFMNDRLNNLLIQNSRIGLTYVDKVAQEFFSFGTVGWILRMSQSLLDQFTQRAKLFPPPL